MITAEQFNNDIKYITYSIEEKLITFAKLHCKAQAKAISENATCSDQGDVNRHGEWSEYYVVDKESILNTYPLDNIL